MKSVKQKYQILVVEDDFSLVNAYKEMLTISGFVVVMAMDGEEATVILERSTPDLIILDLILPKKDGFILLSEIRGSKKLKKVPVLIASNLGEKEDIDRGMSLGADEYIIKSNVSMEELLKKIETLLKKI